MQDEFHNGMCGLHCAKGLSLTQMAGRRAFAEVFGCNAAGKAVQKQDKRGSKREITLFPELPCSIHGLIHINFKSYKCL